MKKFLRFFLAGVVIAAAVAAIFWISVWLVLSGGFEYLRNIVAAKTKPETVLLSIKCSQDMRWDIVSITSATPAKFGVQGASFRDSANFVFRKDSKEVFRFTQENRHTIPDTMRISSLSEMSTSSQFSLDQLAMYIPNSIPESTVARSCLKNHSEEISNKISFWNHDNWVSFWITGK